MKDGQNTAQTKYSTDSKLVAAIREMECFLEEVKDYNAANYWANRERGILKHRSLLVIKKLQEWRR